MNNPEIKFIDMMLTKLIFSNKLIFYYIAVFSNAFETILIFSN